MKKFILTAFASMLALGAGAATLSPEEALARLSSTRHKAPGTAVSSLELIASGEYEGITTYYIFSNDSHAYILGADDLSEPVIGYIDNPVTADTPMPSQLQWWLETYGRQLKRAVDASGGMPATRRRTYATTAASALVGRKIYSAGNASKLKMASGKRTDIAPMIQTLWDQGSPYNNLCPKGTYSGCVATAMAQVMNYHKYPEIGTGTVSTVYNNKVLSLDLSQQPFDWDNMRDNYRYGYTTAQGNAVAYLMQACGYSVEMNYGTDGSGAQSVKVATALVNNFKYDAGIQYLMAQYYSPEEWSDMVYNELANGRPVLYSGSGNGGGHEFVCDGYATDGTFHFNWGWSGAYDGYFPLNGLNPEGQGIGGNDGSGFNEGQDALFGVQKPTGNSQRQEAALMAYGSRLSVTGSENSREVMVSVVGGGFYNLTPYSGNLDLAFQLISKSDEAAYIAYMGSGQLEPYTGYAYLMAEIPSTVPDGTYTLVPVYRLVGNQEWKKVFINNSTPTEITVALGQNSVDAKISIGGLEPIEALDFDDAESSTGFYAGKEADLVVPITNIGTETVSVNLTLYITNSKNAVLSSGRAVKVALDPLETKDFTFTCTINEGVRGSCYAALVDSDNTIIVRYQIKVTDPNALPDLTLETVASDTGFKTGEACAVAATIKNNSTERIDTYAKCYICSLQDEELVQIAAIGKKARIAIVAGKTLKLKYTGTVPENIEPGTYYLAFVTDEDELIGCEPVQVEQGAGSGVEITVADLADDAELYDLQGRRVERSNAVPGIYIVKTGGKTIKVALR